MHLLKLHLSTGFILVQEYFYTEMIPHLHWINVYVPLPPLRLWEQQVCLRCVRCDTDTWDSEIKETSFSTYLTIRNVNKGQSHILRISEQIWCLIFPRRRMQAAQCSPETRPEGRGKYGVNSTLEGAGNSKNYYVHPEPHHLSFQTGRRPRGHHRTGFLNLVGTTCLVFLYLLFLHHTKPRIQLLCYGKRRRRWTILKRQLTEQTGVRRHQARQEGEFIHSFKMLISDSFPIEIASADSTIRGRRVLYSRVCPEHLNDGSTSVNWRVVWVSHLTLLTRGALVVIFLHEGLAS